MRPDRGIVNTPVFDQDLGFIEYVADLSVEQFVSQLAVEFSLQPFCMGCRVQ